MPPRLATFNAIAADIRAVRHVTPWAAAVLLFAIAGLAGCSRPAPAERTVDFPAPANRPVATLGPDDAVPSANGTDEPTPATTGPTPTAQVSARSGITPPQPASVASGPSTSPSLAPPAEPAGDPDLISGDQSNEADD